MPRRLTIRYALIFALVLTAAFPRWSAWILAYAALYPLLRGIHLTRSYREAFSFSYLAGFLFLALSSFWLRYVTWGGLIVFALLDAIFFGVFGVLTKNLFVRAFGTGLAHSPHQMKHPSIARTLFAFFGVPALWVLQEWARLKIPVIGYGFNFLGHSQAAVPVVAQSARIFGALGLSYFVALVGTFFFLLLASYPDGRDGRTLPLLTQGHKITMGCLLVLLFGAVLIYGSESLASLVRDRSLRVSVIQGNVIQENKWDPALKPLIIEKYKKLTQIAKFEGPDLVVWPEAAWPGYLREDFAATKFQTFVDELGAPMIVGSPDADTPEAVFNSALLVEPKKGITARYNKVNLVPFGEYVPFGTFFRLFGIEQYARAMGVSDFWAGTPGQDLFEIAGKNGSAPFRFAALICFEDSFSDFARAFVEAGAEFLLVITNDAWFQQSAGPYQHLQCSIMRALENGVYVVRSANTGVSAFINPRGVVEDRVSDAEGHDIFVTGGLTRPIFTSDEQTIYRKFGYRFPEACFLLYLLTFLPALFTRSRR